MLLRWAGLALALGAAALAYRELLWFERGADLSEELEQLFFVPSQSAAPLVVLLSGWLLYRRAGRLRSLPRDRGAPWLGGLLLGFGALAHVWATLTGAPDLLVPSLACVGLGAAALWKGRAGMRAVLLPSAFLLFAMPLPAPLLGEIVYRLQIATAELTGVLLGLMGIPHHVANEQILRTNQTFSVIEACSGLRTIETLAMVAILMADLFRRSLAHALLLLLASGPVAFFLNGWRSLALILNPHSGLATVHNLQGIATLLGGLVLLFLFDGLLERIAHRRSNRPAAAGVAPAPRARGAPPAAAAIGAVAALLAALGVASSVLPRFQVARPETLGLSKRLASGIPGFSEELAVDRVFLGSAGFRESAIRRFPQAGHAVDVFVGIGWRGGRARSALSPKTAFPGSGWVLEREQTQVLRPDGRRIHSLLFRSETQWVLVYHWYEGSLGLAREAARSLAALDASPLRRRGEIVAVRIATDVEGPVATGLDPAATRLAAFYKELRRVLDSMQLEMQASRGKALPDLAGRERYFPDGIAENPHGMLGNQAVGASDGLGMSLATPG